MGDGNRITMMMMMIWWNCMKKLNNQFEIYAKAT